MQNIYNLGSTEGGEDQIERSASVGDACVGPACVLGQESRRLNWGTTGDSGIKVRMCTLAPAARLKLECRGGEEGGGDPLRSWGKMSEREGVRRECGEGLGGQGPGCVQCGCGGCLRGACLCAGERREEEKAEGKREPGRLRWWYGRAAAARLQLASE